MNYTDAGYVYSITNKVNGKKYIGSTINPKRRWIAHKNALRNGKHHSFILQKAWDKYGEVSFSFAILLVCPAQARVEYEERIMPIASYNLFRTNLHKPVLGEKISKALLGKPKTEAHRAAISAGKTGMKMDPEFCKKARARQLGVTPTLSTREKLSTATTKTRRAEKNKHRGLVIGVYTTYQLGDSITAMCEEQGISTSTFYNHCVEMALPSVKEKAVSAAVDEIENAMKRGESFTTACKNLGLPPNNMRAIVARRRG